MNAPHTRLKEESNMCRPKVTLDG